MLITFKWICIVVKRLYYFIVFYENLFEDQRSYFLFYMCRVFIYAADVIFSISRYLLFDDF